MLAILHKNIIHEIAICLEKENWKYQSGICFGSGLSHFRDPEPVNTCKEAEFQQVQLDISQDPLLCILVPYKPERHSSRVLSLWQPVRWSMGRNVTTEIKWHRGPTSCLIAPNLQRCNNRGCMLQISSLEANYSK